MLAGIRDILVISTPHGHAAFRSCSATAGSGASRSSTPCSPSPTGWRRRSSSGASSSATTRSRWCWATTSSSAHGLSEPVQSAATPDDGRTVFGYHVQRSRALRRRRVRRARRARSYRREAEAAASNYAVTGLYFYDNEVARLRGQPAPVAARRARDHRRQPGLPASAALRVERLGRGNAWLDTGTHESLLQASSSSQRSRSRQGLKIACLEEIAYRMGFIDAASSQRAGGADDARTSTASTCWRWSLSRGVTDREGDRNPLAGVVLIEPRLPRRARVLPGDLSAARYVAAGITAEFVQDNHSSSRPGHAARPPLPGAARAGADGPGDSRRGLRRRRGPRRGRRRSGSGSAPSCQTTARQLSSRPGSRTASASPSPTADVSYKCTALYVPGTSRGIAWNDPDVGITWPSDTPLLSPQDRGAPRLKDAPLLPGDSDKPA